jgi:hypothetical protein
MGARENKKVLSDELSQVLILSSWKTVKSNPTFMELNVMGLIPSYFCLFPDQSYVVLITGFDFIKKLRVSDRDDAYGKNNLKSVQFWLIIMYTIKCDTIKID